MFPNYCCAMPIFQKLYSESKLKIASPSSHNENPQQVHIAPNKYVH